jgi:hypothetical protein
MADAARLARRVFLAILAFSASRIDFLERISNDSKTFISTSALCLPLLVLDNYSTSGAPKTSQKVIPESKLKVLKIYLQARGTIDPTIEVD